MASFNRFLVDFFFTFKPFRTPLNSPVMIPGILVAPLNEREVPRQDVADLCEGNQSYSYGCIGN